MSSKSLASYGENSTDLISRLSRLQAVDYSSKSPQEQAKVEQLFKIGLSNINVLFPNLNVPVTSLNADDYISKWLKRYYDAHTNRPSTRHANVKHSVNDPALGVIVETREGWSTQRLDDSLSAHNLFMSAENIQGALLEEYINSIASTEGWIWAEGETLRACDFVRFNAQALGSEFIQIKNRDNTENSSSSAIRNGTQIKKWNRLTTHMKNKRPVPSFNWDQLNTLMHIQSA
ncbi:hypothetical protein LROSL1_0274 [Furfurilactobacillus rossiae]|nr:SinI family restriction endonuclease [Furfurilactobacillus rossiae]QLE63094.1 hypothetical protein LROSL1_0274 [Furfurilactobacillus rossiae]